MRKVRGIVGVLVVALVAQGCSVGMALSGKKEPNLGAFGVGSTRGEVELQLGSPTESVTRSDGGRTDVYEYQLGNEKSTGRAVGHAALDVLTLGLWEIAGTPIEAVGIENKRISIMYDENDRVKAINQLPPKPKKEQVEEAAPGASPEEAVAE